MPKSALIRLLRTEKVVIFLPVSPHSSTTWPHCTTMKEESWTDSAYWRATASFGKDHPCGWSCEKCFHSRPGNVGLLQVRECPEVCAMLVVCADAVAKPQLATTAIIKSHFMLRLLIDGCSS